ncbi:MAG: EAL domain-containing protein [Roseiflexaceae bacterium]|nr:EAL domain-containing protein [Roseiflexaceae bacterium]
MIACIHLGAKDYLVKPYNAVLLNARVSTIISLARALSLQAVAEGAETIQQVNLLRELECTYGQGWLFSKALDAEAIEELVRSERALLESPMLSSVSQ